MIRRRGAGKKTDCNRQSVDGDYQPIKQQQTHQSAFFLSVRGVLAFSGGRASSSINAEPASDFRTNGRPCGLYFLEDSISYGSSLMRMLRNSTGSGGLPWPSQLI